MVRRSVPVVLTLVTLALFVAPLVFRVAPLHADDESGPKTLADRLRETNLSLQVEEVPFAEVVDLLRAQTGINILIDPRIRSDIAEAPVTGLMLADVDLHTVLDLLASAGGEQVTWTLQGDVVLITAHELLPTRLDVRIYPVAELVAARTSFLPPPAGRSLLAGSPVRGEEDPVQRYGSADELIELVRCTVSPRFWEETEGADIRTLGEGRLVVSATPEIHDAILTFLTQLENRGPDALRVEIHVLDASTLPPEVAGIETDVALRDETALGLLGGRKDGACPSFTLAVRDGVTSTAFAGTRRTFVAAYIPRFAGGTTTPDPDIDTQELGLAVRVRAVTGGGGDDRILLKLGVALAKAGDAPLSKPSEGPSIALPGLVRTERESTLLLTPGRWHLAEGSTGGADAGTNAFLVRVSPLDPERSGPPSSKPFVVPTSTRRGAGTQLTDIQVAAVQWEDANLDQVMAFLRTISGLNFYITPRVRAEVYEDVLISLDLADISLRTVLDLVTEPFELRWILKDNLIVIDQKADRGADMRLRYFDVKDLTEGIAPTAHARGTLRTTEQEPKPIPLYDVDALVDLIRETIGRYDMWEDPATIEARNGILIVRNEPHVLDAVDWLLTGLRGSVGVVVTTVDQLVVDAATASVLTGTETGGGCPWLLEPAHLSTIEAAILAGNATRLGRERVISVQGSGTPKTTGEEIRYVADYDVLSEDVSVPVRRVATLRSGASLGVRTMPGYPGSPVYVEIEYERSVLSAMEPFATPHGPIDLPLTDVWRVATGMRIPHGRTAVVSASRVGSEVRLLLVTPRRVDRTE